MNRDQRPAPPQSWVHDVVDAAGRVHSETLDAAPSADDRRRRLAGHGIDPGDILLGPALYRLSPQHPYQASPEAWMDAYQGDWSAGPGVNQVWWRLPATFSQFWATCNLYFAGLAAGPALLSIEVEIWPHLNATGTVVVDIGAFRTEIPVSAPATRTIDIAFQHDGSPVLTTMVLLRQGIYDFVVHRVRLGRPPVIHVDPIEGTLPA